MRANRVTPERANSNPQSAQLKRDSHPRNERKHRARRGFEFARLGGSHDRARDQQLQNNPKRETAIERHQSVRAI